jgi:SAM-dependent methyltransferase
MKECSKSIQRRLSDSNFLRRYFAGKGVDIGGKPDPLCLYKEFFPLMSEVRTWDWEDGDAQFLKGVANNTLDFVHSSHCLEHLVDPIEGLKNWFRVVREGGYLIVTVPDEDLYEQGVFPSVFNRDHKWTFTIFKQKSWSERSINLLDTIRELSPSAEVVKLEQLSTNYRFGLPRFDQTLTPVAECGIELIIRKRPIAEIEAGGRWNKTQLQPDREVLLHLNQYKDDMQTMKLANKGHPPFANESAV